jgi:hypothetical protein
MTPTDAHSIAIRYKNIWRGGPSSSELERSLARMEADRAHRIIDQLTRTHEHPPTIAHIWRLHDDTPTTPGWEHPTDTGPAIPPHIGRRVAWQAYVAECRGQGREPNRTWFNDTIGAT